ncbi:MAG TPA: hypothetical protein DEV93_11030 [Chloroflexi bacterium]|jgi:hypothetical protein|nr:hypothetical protein [Blastocatellia bacterium]HCG01063.1 hypothetical protein [Chloroflexota bacterium]
MLYDAFICHASEDKDPFVREFANELKANHVEVWYDEFSLRLGDSLRQAIDRGLANSRFGIVVLSPAFFSKNWPQRELDGLVQREMSGGEKVILPVWHNVTRDEVENYSLPLAARVATRTLLGMAKVVENVVAVIKPEGSPLVIARDILLAEGMTPPVVTDKYWLRVAEASNRVDAMGAVIPESSAWGRWSFPLPAKEENAEAWGERLAWAAMQDEWTSVAESRPITLITAPKELHEFLLTSPGLLDACAIFPELAAEYAPQLTIPGFEGPLKDVIEEAYQTSLTEYEVKASLRESAGAGLAVKERLPACDVVWCLRHPNFGNYKIETVLHSYFHPDGVFGPPVDYYEGADHLFWLLSSQSEWLPTGIRKVLTDGMREWGREWLWGDYFPHRGDNGGWQHCGALGKEVSRASDGRGKARFVTDITADLIGRINSAREKLGLPEDPSVLFDRFVQGNFLQAAVLSERRLDRHRRGSTSKPKKKQS